MTDQDESAEAEPKIIVDDDWKEQVAKEKAAAASGADSSDTDSDATDSSDTESSDTESSDTESSGTESSSTESSESDVSAGVNSDDMPAPPPASFEMLIMMMYTQAMSMLGQMPDPTTGATQVNKPFAKHYIDTLEMIGEKTQGNLTEEETKMHGEALHTLRMAYVSTKAT